MNALEHCWHPVAWSVDLKDKPLSIKVLDRELVAFRDAAGMAHVLDDRCLHKGVKLSPGKCSGRGIQCPYHGWVYNGDGALISIPSQLEHDVLPQRAIKSYHVIEKQGTVWFTLSDTPFEAQPPDWHFYDKASFTTVVDMDCEYVRLMENLIDNPHAGYIHGGLLRGKPSSHVTARVSETGQGVHVQTMGEKARNSLIYRVFGEKDRDIEHTEEYIVPNIIRTIFSHPGRTHASSQFVCVPVSERKTRVYYRITLDFICARWFIPFFKMMVDKVILQDKAMLEHEAEQEWTEPEFKKLACPADTPSIWMSKMARAYAQQGPSALDASQGKMVEINYFL